MRQDRHDHQCDDVDDLDQRVNGWAGSILVGIAHGVAGNRCLVCIGTFAAEVALLDVLLRVGKGGSVSTYRTVGRFCTILA